jgi:hypothetical protein
MKSIFLPVLLVIANVTGAGMILPQVVQLHRNRVADGLSGAWVGVGITMNLWWVAYAIQGGLWGIAPVSVGGAVLYTIIARQFYGITGAAALPPLAVGAFAGLAPAPFLIIGGWQLAAVAIGLCYGAQFAPAALAALGSTRLDGVSPLTWTLAWIEAAIWLPYGMAVGDTALLVGGAGGTLMASIILIRLAQTSRSGQQPTGRTPLSFRIG